jgi:hypothetical protein
MGLAVALPVVARQEAAGRIIPAYTEGSIAFAKKQFGDAVKHFSRALGNAPSQPGLMAELARAEHMAGDTPRAIARLAAALRLGSGLDVVDDPAIAALLSRPEAASAREAADALRKPVGTATEAFRLSERDLIPEGITYDPADRSFYVGSIYRRKIVRVAADGKQSTFAGAQPGSLLSPLGMKVDPRRGVLWVATEGNLNMHAATAAEDGTSALLAFDLRNGQVVRKYVPPAGPRRHLFNDVVIDREGTVFVTDSEEGSVYLVRRLGDRLERLVGPGVMEYPNGIALASDERRLFVAHVGGIAVIDVAAGRVSPLPHPESVSLADVDGLYRDGRRLIAVQNGLTPPRVALFTMDEGETRVTGMSVIERGHPLFAGIPTTGVIVDGVFYLIANAQLRAFTADHRILPIEKLQESVILKAPLPR